jgi:23S rRNA (cytosine1962-C5)-methyltransferase
MPIPSVVLERQQTHRCLDGHLWVYRSELGAWSEPPADGAEVEVRDWRNRLVGRGFYSESSQIAVRLLSRSAVALDTAFLHARLRAALAHRQVVMPDRPARRLVSSEGDLLPGLIVDQYADRLVVQATTVGMDRRLPAILDLLVSELAPRQVVERDDLPVRLKEGLTERAGVLIGPTDTTLRLRIGRAEVEVDLLDPHKTGAYLDQQLNHEVIARWIRPGDRVLDLCSHLGGFAIHALLAGAGQALALDQSQRSLEGALVSARLAGVDARLTTVCADAFTWLAEADRERGAGFDVVVLDPPSFTRNRASVAQALKGYDDLHRRALHRLGQGGRLLTFSCSHHISATDFLASVTAAATASRRTLRLDAVLGAAPDHPLLPTVPESEYLKGFVFTVIEAPTHHEP